MNAPLPRRDRGTRLTPDWRRRYASYGTSPRDCGCPHAFHADPLDCMATPPGPSTYGLPTTVLYRHAAALAAQGWAEWELRRRFALRAVPAA